MSASPPEGERASLDQLRVAVEQLESLVAERRMLGDEQAEVIAAQAARNQRTGEDARRIAALGQAPGGTVLQRDPEEAPAKPDAVG